MLRSLMMFIPVRGVRARSANEAENPPGQRRTTPWGRMSCGFVMVSGFVFSAAVGAREPDRWMELWPELAPGESQAQPGEPLPLRPDEHPPATRIRHITQPRLAVYAPQADGNGTAVVIFPGGGYNYVVADKEGSEAAEWLNRLGITAYVLHYRTKNGEDGPAWRRPLQDGQRAIRLLRFQTREAAESVDPTKIGVLGFSAGGQVAALVATRFMEPSYEPSDEIDHVSAAPSFALLIYPWRLVVAESEVLMPELRVTDQTPPTFLLHAHDDNSTSMSSVMFYVELKRRGIPAELHVFAQGGHGYGMRNVPGTNIHTWPDLAREWLVGRGLADSPTGAAGNARP